MNHEMVKQAYDEICGLEKEAATVDGNKIFLDKEDYEVLPYTVKDRMKDLAKSPAGKALAGVGLTAAGVGGAAYGINKYKAMKRRRAEQEQADKVAAAYNEICGFEKEAKLSEQEKERRRKDTSFGGNIYRGMMKGSLIGAGIGGGIGGAKGGIKNNGHGLTQIDLMGASKKGLKGAAEGAIGGALVGVGSGLIDTLRKREEARKEEAAEKAAAYYDEAQYAKEAALSDYDEACAYEAAALEVLDELGYLD